MTGVLHGEAEVYGNILECLDKLDGCHNWEDHWEIVACLAEVVRRSEIREELWEIVEEAIERSAQEIDAARRNDHVKCRGGDYRLV